MFFEIFYFDNLEAERKGVSALNGLNGMKSSKCSATIGECRCENLFAFGFLSLFF